LKQRKVGKKNVNEPTETELRSGTRELDKLDLLPTNLTNDAGSLYLYLSSPLLLLEGSSPPFLFSSATKGEPEAGY